MYHRIASLFFVLALLAPASLLAADDPFVGSWKSSKSSNINTYEPAGNGSLKVTVSRVTKGVPNSHSRIEIYDGKPHPIEGEDGSHGTQPTDHISVRRINSHTIVGENWFQGKVRASFTVSVSPDGKTLTKTVKGTKNGQPYEDVRISHKQ